MKAIDLINYLDQIPLYFLINDVGLICVDASSGAITVLGSIPGTNQFGII